jgi:quercetin dioxygenase-like cupin family protein
MPEHDHGVSEIVLIPLSGSVNLHHDGQARTLSAGMTAHIATGERVSLANPGAEPASLMVVTSPPQIPHADETQDEGGMRCHAWPSTDWAASAGQR